jgi:hypothetical protein
MPEGWPRPLGAGPPPAHAPADGAAHARPRTPLINLLQELHRRDDIKSFDLEKDGEHVVWRRA